MVDDEQNKGKTKYNVSRAHMKHCGNILRQCVRCKAYVERKYFDSHNKLCSKSLSLIDSSKDQNASYGQLKGTSSRSSTALQVNRNSEFEHLRPKSQLHVPATAHLVNSQPFLYTATDETNNVPMPKSSIAERSKMGLPSPYSSSSLNKDGNFMAHNKYNNSYDDSLLASQNYLDTTTHFQSPANLGVAQLIHSDIASLKNQMNEEKIQREKLVNDIFKMKKQYLLSEERNSILLATIATLRTSIEDEADKHKTTYSLMSSEIDILKQNNEELQQKISQMEAVTSDLQKDVEKSQIDISHLDLVVNAQDTKLRSLGKTESNLDIVKEELEEEQQIRKDVTTHIQKEMGQLKELLAVEISKYKQEIHKIEKSVSDVEERFQSKSEEGTSCTALTQQSQALMAVVEEDTKKITNLDDNIKKITNSVAALQKQLHLNNLEHKLLTETAVHDRSGHLMWKIDDFEEKLKDSVANDSMIQSPIFYTSKYGYALQAEVYLNGLSKWKGRHIAAAVFVVPGLWDPLLSWPIRVTAKIILKDQASKPAQAVHIIKTIQIRKKDQKDTLKLLSRNSLQANSSKSTETLSTVEREARAVEANIKKQYVFIQHSSLDKFDYIKHNRMYIEIVTEHM